MGLKLRWALAPVALAAFAGPSLGDVIQLGNGWEVEIFDPAHSAVTRDPDDPNHPGAIILQKSAEFLSLNPILLQFRQNLPDAQTATRICITDEIINNNSGVAWVDFEMTLLDSGDATWNQALSAGFSIAPFTNRQYLDAGTRVRFFDGTVPNGGVWTPGLPSGELCFDINLSSASPVAFTLEERPSIPTPGALALLGVGGLAAMRRRR